MTILNAHAATTAFNDDDDDFAVEAHTMRRSNSHITNAIFAQMLHTCNMSTVFGAHTNSTQLVSFSTRLRKVKKAFEH